MISLIGAELKTETDAAGRFGFSNLTGEHVTLVVQRVGYRPLTKSVRVGDRTVDLAVTEAAFDLDDIVVTGPPGETEARAVGHAVGTVHVPDVLQAAPVTDMQHLLNARVPGLLIMPYQGNVGTGGRTRMRGVSSLTLPNEPLIYLDGVRIDNNPRAGPDIRNRRQIARVNDLSAEDIERIEVIKGAAAATLYGIDASHGVIQILTRRGAEGPLRFGLTAKQGGNWFMNPSGRLPILWGRRSPTDTFLTSLNLHDQEAQNGKPIFRTGGVQSYGLTAGGGTAGARFYLSGSFDRDEGMLWYNWRQRVSARANLDLTPHERIGIAVSIGTVSNRVRLGAQAQTYDVMTQLVWGHPRLLDSLPQRGFRMVPPEISALIESRDEITRFIGSVRINHQPWPWLSQRLTLGTDRGDESSSRFFPRPEYDSLIYFEDQSEGEITVSRWQVGYATLDYVAAASYGLTEALLAETSVGAQYNSRRSHMLEVVGTNLPPGIASLSAAANATTTEELIGSKTIGVFGQQQLGWKRRLFLTGAIRFDNNSAFGPDLGFAVYPRLSGAWVVSEEPFWRVGFLDALRVRAAWGRTGQQPDAFGRDSSFQSVTGPGDISVITPGNPGSPNLRPERTQEFELGFEAGLWDSRLSVNFTYFRQQTHDAIALASLAPSTGFSIPRFVNVGRTSNRGFELAVDADLVTSKSVTWDLGVTISTNKNRVESLGGLRPISLVSLNPGGQAYDAQYHQEGFPLGSYFMAEVVSAVFDTSGNLVMWCAGAGGPDRDLVRANPGELVPCDLSAPRVYAGQPTPTWEGAIRTGVTLFRNLRLYCLVDFRGGHVMTNLDAGFAHLTARNSRAINDSSDPYLLAYDRLNSLSLTGVNRRAGFMNAGFAKLREVSATWTLPSRIAARFRISHGSITVAGRNLAFLWRAQKEVYGVRIVDPEVGFPEDLNGRVQNALPQYAQFITSLRLTF